MSAVDGQSTPDPDQTTSDTTEVMTERRRATGRRLVDALRRDSKEDHDVRKGIDWLIFGVTAAIAVGFVVWGLAWTSSLGSVSGGALDWVIKNAGWAFVLLASSFVVYVIWLAASRYGAINLGDDGERPEFKTVSWIAMMFSAGMGIGLMFYGVAEPLWHFVAPPPDGAPPSSYAAAQEAMATSMFHWALHPWAIYAVVGIAIAYGTFRRGRSQLMSSIFTPLFGERAVKGLGGKVIDMLAIFATLFGSAASLGLGALQIAGGITKNGWAASVGESVLVGIIVVLTLCFILSATSGIARGIQWLSNINMVLALTLALFVFVAGPTVFILDVLPLSLFDYARDLPNMMGRTDAAGAAPMADWLATWTVFYWAWWISWTPFVGMFIARISRGRTIRQFVAGVLVVPSLVSLVWFGIFGGAGIREEMNQPGSVGVQYEQGVGTFTFESALFDLLGNYPLASITTVLVMVLVGIFFVSGADAASIVMGTLSEKGVTEPTRPTVIFWGAATGAVAAIMLIAGGGGAAALESLQSITIVAALPFVVVMVGVMIALTKDLRNDPMMLRQEFTRHLVNEAVVVGVDREGEDFSLVQKLDGTPAKDDYVVGRFGEHMRPQVRPDGGSTNGSNGLRSRVKSLFRSS